MAILMGIFFGLYGLAIGSFLNVCIYRLPLGLSVVKGRSHCPHCGHVLSAWELIPLVGWLVLGGRCRYCHAPISPRYPAVEALTACLFLGCYGRFGLSLAAIFYSIVCSALLTVSVIDWQSMEIPDGLNLLLAAMGVVGILCGVQSPGRALAGLLAVSVPFLLISLATGGGIGGGDIKLVAAMGAILGPASMVLAALIGCISAAVYGLLLLAAHKAHRQQPIPLGPFLALGCTAAIFGGETLIGWYLHLL